MFKNLKQVKRFPEEAVKFYAAQLASSLAYLHEQKLVHRDLKLENVLLDSDGYIKLCDFGLAKLLNCQEDITYTFGGTGEYLAPEIVNNKGHSFPVDWWTLGIITYELGGGRTPFFSQNRHLINRLITKGKIIFPDPIKHKIKMSEEMKDFISSLLVKDPDYRLGTNSHNEVFDHPWFSGLDWKKLGQKKFKPPLIPKTEDS